MPTFGAYTFAELQPFLVQKAVEDNRQQSSIQGHLPGLDGLRVIAIFVVCLFHFGFVFNPANGPLEAVVFHCFSFGWAGVDLFFALSGFLITGGLIDSRASGTEHYFTRFYLRRVLRIFPLYFAFIAAVFVITEAIVPGHYKPIPWVWYIAYLQNWKGTEGVIFVSHLWSLAIEEQFYFVWPFVVFVLPTNLLYRACIALFLAAVVLRLALAGKVESILIFQGTLTRMDGLVLGSASAIAIRNSRLRSVWLTWGKPLAAFCIVILLFGLVRHRSFDFDNGLVTVPCLAIAFSVWALVAADRAPTWTTRPIIKRIAQCAYGIYVFHEFFSQLFTQRVSQAVHWIDEPYRVVIKATYISAMLAATYFAARLSWRWFESPLLKYKRIIP